MRTLLFLVAVLLPVLSFDAFAQADSVFVQKKINSRGWEFYMTFPIAYEDGSSGASALMLYFTSTRTAHVSVEVKGKSLVFNKTVKPGSIAFVRLSPSEGQVFSKTGSQAAPPEQVYKNSAVHIVSDAPITVNACLRYQFTSDSFTLLPIESLDTTYVVSSYPDMSEMYPGLDLPSETFIVAAHDSTVVDFTLLGSLITTTTGGMKRGDTKSFVLNKGDVLPFCSNGDRQDLSGSKIRSNKPVAVFSGNQCANVPIDKPWCDYIAEMEMPVTTWDTAYMVPTPHTRLQGCIIRIYAKKQGTKVFRNGTYWKTIGYPNVGLFIEERNNSLDPILYTADAPISITMYNPGQSDDNIVSDPFQMNMVGAGHFTNFHTLNTPGNKQSSYSFATNYLMVLYPLSEDATIPADFEFGIHSETGRVSWASVATRFGSQIGKSMPVLFNNKRWAVKYITLPGDAVYSLRAKEPFFVYQYGFSNYDSYGMWADVSSAELGSYYSNDTIAPNIVLAQDTAFGLTGVVSDKEPQASGLAFVELDSTSYNAKLRVGGFNIGTTENVPVIINKISTNTSMRAVVRAIDKRGNVSLKEMPLVGFATPKLELQNGTTEFCLGNSATFLVNGAFAYYHWNDGTRLHSKVFTPTTAGTYRIYCVVTDAHGYSLSSDSITVVVHPAPDSAMIIQNNSILRLNKQYTSYQWLRNGTAIGGATTSSYGVVGVDLPLGIYTVVVTNEFGCTATSAPLKVTTSSVENDNEAISVYPSVVSSTLWVAAPRNESVVVEITSLNGSNVLTQTVAPLAGSKAAVDVSMLAKGSYIVTVKVAANKESFKIIKE